MNGTLTQRLENLSPAKRLLLEMKLKGKTPASKESFYDFAARLIACAAPLSFNQESLLFMERLNPNTATYNIYEAVRLTGDLDLTPCSKRSMQLSRGTNRSARRLEKSTVNRSKLLRAPRSGSDSNR